MRVALYERVSTEDQAVNGISIEAQTAALDAWAKDHTVVDHYIDDGISARKPPEKRPELQRMLRDVEAGRIDMIVFTKLDRFFRSVGAYYKVQDVLEKYNVPWKAIQEDYETQTASGRLKVNIMLSVAQDEADRTSERIKAVFERKRELGEECSGKVPLGLKMEEKHLVPSDDAPIIQEMFKTYLATRSKKAVQNYLASLGYNRGVSSINWMLKNERYRQIVPEFDQVQKVMKEREVRRARTERVYIFAGLLKCPKCGGSLISMHSRGHTYYQCNRHHSGIGCVPTCYDEVKVEERLLDVIRPAIEGHNIEVRKKNRPSQAPQIKQKLNRLKDLYVNGLIDLNDYKHDYAELKAALDEEESREKEIDVPKVMTSLEAYQSFTPAKRAAFWKQVCSSVVMYPDDAELYFI